MRGAIYARTAVLSPDRAEHQIRICREFAEKRGWSVGEAHVFRDNGIAGTDISRRFGLEALLKSSSSKPRPFDVVLVEEISRLGRNVADVMSIIDKLSQEGVTVFAVTQELDSGNISFRSCIASALRPHDGVVSPENVRRIYGLFLAGYNVEQITNALNEED